MTEPYRLPTTGSSGADFTGAGGWTPPRPPTMLCGHRLSSAEFELSWPIDLFLAEAHALHGRGGERQQLLVHEAFTTEIPASCLAEDGQLGLTGDNGAFLVLLQHADELGQRQIRPPYFRTRRAMQASADEQEPDPPELLSWEFTQLVAEWDQGGYFDRVFTRDCQESGQDGANPSRVMERELHWVPTWPLDPNQLGDRDLLFDVIEFLHDHIARPRRAVFHTPECTHYVDPAPEIARRLYRRWVNELLDGYAAGFRLGEEGDGEDEGRLVSTTDEAREGLVQSMTARTDPVTGDLVRYAIHLFRKRDATDDDKRTAIEKLYQVLEPARKAGHFRSAPLTKADEDLFGIANRYAIRHGDGKAEQIREYDSAYLDWLFWWYLATVELADRLSDPSRTTTP